MKVKIHHHTYDIIEVDSFEDAPAKTIAFGHTDFIKQTIRLNKHLKSEQKRQTLMHELTHAFMWCYGYGQIEEQMPVEVMCDFVGCFAEDIIRITDKYMGGKTDEDHI